MIPPIHRTPPPPSSHALHNPKCTAHILHRTGENSTILRGACDLISMKLCRILANRLEVALEKGRRYIHATKSETRPTKHDKKCQCGKDADQTEYRSRSDKISNHSKPLRPFSTKWNFPGGTITSFVF